MKHIVKISGNSLCPCLSQKKYKNCCRIFHYGEKAKNALELMKSRYSAFVTNNSSYIINTTHKDNPDFTYNTEVWEKDINDFIKHSDFKKLEILEFIEDEYESFVTFKVTIFQGLNDVSFIEKSRFLREKQEWLYHSGDFL